MSGKISAVVVCTVLWLHTSALGEDWPSYRHDLSNSGRTSETGITKANVASLKVKWKFNAGATISVSPAVATINGTRMVFFGAWNGIFYALNANTRANIWSYPIDKVGQCSVSTCPIIASSASVVNGVVYFGASNAFMYALNAATGKLVWKNQIADPNQGYDIWTSPAVYNGVVYTGLASHDDAPCIPGQVVALNTSDGSIKWRFNTIDPTSCPSGTCVGAAVWSSPALDTAANILYIDTGNPGSTCSPATADATRYPDSILAIRMVGDANGAAGTLVNYYQALTTDTQDLDFGSSPVLHNTGTLNACTGASSVVSWVSALNKNGTVYMLQRGSGGLADHLNTVHNSGCCENLASMGVLQKSTRSACSTTKFTTTYSNELFVPLGNGGFVGVNQSATGSTSKVFTDSFSTAALWSAPAIINTIAFVGANDNYIRAVNSTGTVLWKFPTGGRVPSGPAISGGRVYVGSYDGNLYCFSVNGA